MSAAPWRLGRGWPEVELQGYLAAATDRAVNFDVPIEQMTPEHGWIVDGVVGDVAMEPPGPPVPDGPFARARAALIHYDFSDPRIVVGHFDPSVPLLGRTMLLEIKVLGVLRFLGSVRIRAVRDEQADHRSTFGFRYDTLGGHFERGFEWFLVEKDHARGTIRCTIEAHWRTGDFPTWWSRLGFRIVGGFFREHWRQRALARLGRLAQQPVTAPRPEAGLAHRGFEAAERTE